MNEDLAVGDVVTVPCWHQHAIKADADAILLRVTDEPLLRKVGLVRTGDALSSVMPGLDPGIHVLS